MRKIFPKIFLAAVIIGISALARADVTIILTDADLTQLFGDDQMMDECLKHGGGRCVRVQQLLLIRVQEAARKPASPASVPPIPPAPPADNKP